MSDIELASYRAQIDEVDALLLETLARRFAITAQIGEYKAAKKLPPADPKREESQIATIRKQAQNNGLNPDFAEQILRSIMAEVVSNHSKVNQAKQAKQVKNNSSLLYNQLKEKQRKLREDKSYPDDLMLKIHRALSWLNQAELCGGDKKDDDQAFIYYWIAFNAAYANEGRKDSEGKKDSERSLLFDYFTRIARVDKNKQISNAVWVKFPGPIRLLIDNQFTFQPFWNSLNQNDTSKNWKIKFESDKKEAKNAVMHKDTISILSFLFDRLYCLRNQILHGGATWNSKVNRDQIRDGRNILALLVPIFIDLMMDNPEINWGDPYYPNIQS